MCNPHRVAIVVDPDFATRLEGIAGRVHVWIAATVSNRAAAKRYWESHPTPIGAAALEAGVTTFDVDASQSADDWCSAILSTVEEHHGEYSHVPPVSELEIYGTTPTPTLRSALEEFGFAADREDANGFHASRSIAG
jgi:hypothetical protein